MKYYFLTVIFFIMYQNIIQYRSHGLTFTDENIIWLSAVYKNNYVLTDDSLCCVSKLMYVQYTVPLKWGEINIWVKSEIYQGTYSDIVSNV